MESKLKKITYLAISLLMALLLNNTLIFNNGAQTNFSVEQTTFNNLKSSQVYSGIEIDALMAYNTTYSGNWTWAVSQPWCYIDNGVYVIENMTIDATSSPIDSGILIKNSNDDSFIVRNCTITNANGAGGYLNYAAGIKLINCSNGVIYNNNCSNGATYGCGILVYDGSFNITISENTVQNNGRHGILAADSSYNLSITCNNVTHTTYYGIYLYEFCDNNTIIGNGIYLYNSNNNTIQGNIANDNADEGIDLNRYCDYNRVIGNIANNNPSDGIQLYSGCDFNIVSGNNVSNNDNGIRLNSNCRNTTILNNNASYNKRRGICLNTDSTDNNITENTVNNNNQHGIYLDFNCDFNNIINNTINDNTDMGINLYYSDSNVIKNNTINRNDLGIGLDRSSNNNISGNTLIDNNCCIYETQSSGNIIEYNYCSPPTVQEPIFIDGAATGVGAHNWTWAEKQSWCSGSGTWNDPYIIENLEINGFGIVNGKGIDIVQSDVSFIIQDCLIYNSDTGIYLQDVNNARLINNNCSNLNLGMDIDTCDNNTISGNTVNGNTDEGIYLYECNNNTISGNTANYNGDSGICLDYANNNTLSGNTANDNGDSGIYIEEGSNNTISGNSVNNNGDSGIYLYYLCSNNIISGNTANDNGYSGIYLDECYNNTISGNTVNDNNLGIYLSYYCVYNDIIDNIFYNNTLGISIDSNCNNNSIYQNFFLENGIHAVDDGTDNNWNSTSIGNYWDNWTSPDVSPNDGIVDDPYTFIGGFAGSIDYLPIAEDGAPLITINSPASSDVFGVNAPSFDVTITDTTLVSMWYTNVVYYRWRYYQLHFYRKWEN